MEAQAAVRGGTAPLPPPPPPGATALIVTLKKANKKNADEYFSFSFYAF